MHTFLLINMKRPNTIVNKAILANYIHTKLALHHYVYMRPCVLSHVNLSVPLVEGFLVIGFTTLNFTFNVVVQIV